MMVQRAKGQPARRRQRTILAVVVATLLALLPVVAMAHPLGNFTINRFSRVTVFSDHIEVMYVMDAAEVPTYQAMPLIDTNRDDAVDEAESASYIADQQKRLTPLLSLLVDNQPLTLEPTTGVLEFPPGQAKLPTLRLTLHYTAALPAGDLGMLTFRNDTYADRLGWQEIVVTGADGVTLANSTAPSESVSDELRAYPEALLQQPLEMKEATFAVAGGGTAPSATGAPQAGVVPNSSAGSSTPFGASSDGFAELITQPLDTPWGIFLALGVAVLLGGAHALTPGHGKTIVGAYLVGARGTAKHALFLGLTTTITHTAGVFALGFITLFLSRYILPEQLYPWLGAFSGLMVVSIGIELLRQRWRAMRDPSYADHSHDHATLHEHGDGIFPHHHQPVGANSDSVSWRNLLTLGVSGGLVPCPSALVLLLSAIALGRTGIGLVLILAFSIGLAGVLTGIGLLMVYAGKLFQKVPTQGRFFRVAPVLSAIFIIGAGLVIAWQAFALTGVPQVAVSALR
jgi:nickel/cobalt exporter